MPPFVSPPRPAFRSLTLTFCARFFLAVFFGMVAPPPRLWLHHAFALQLGDLVGLHAEPGAQDVGVVLTQERRRRNARRPAVDADRPRRHLERAGGMLHHLHDAALLEAGIVLQL